MKYLLALVCVVMLSTPLGAAGPAAASGAAGSFVGATTTSGGIRPGAAAVGASTSDPWIVHYLTNWFLLLWAL
jgi:hypothetical protein